MGGIGLTAAELGVAAVVGTVAFASFEVGMVRDGPVDKLG